MLVWRGRSMPWFGLALLPILVSPAIWPDGEAGNPQLSREQAKADLEDFRRRLLEVHPDPHRRATPTELDAQFERAIGDLPASVSHDELYVTLAKIASRLGDSHTSVAPPRVDSELTLPFYVAAETVILARDAGPLPAGSRVLRVDGYSVEAILDSIRPLASAESAGAVDVVLPSLFAFGHRRFGASAKGAVLDAVTPEGTPLQVSLSRADLDVENDNAVESGFFPNGAVYLRVRTMAGSVREYRDFFRDFFAELERANAPGLIVDFRDNDGGNTLVGQMLLSYLTRRPYRIFGEKRWRVSTPMQHHMRNMGPWADRYCNATPGEYIREVPPLEPPPPVEHRFRGPSVLLIGPRTRSAAMMTANAARDFDLLPVLGTPTTSPPNFFGESYRYDLPHSGLRASISTAEFIRANGDSADPGTVAPHLEVPDRLGLVSVQDEVVSVALALIDRHAELLAGGREGRNFEDSKPSTPSIAESAGPQPLAKRADFR
ncbi:MAG: S41 family peptidase [Myxococcota bacterium]